jgi:hypothetical protein
MRQAQHLGANILQLEEEVPRDGSQRRAGDASDGGGDQPLEADRGRPGGADRHPEGGERKKMVSRSAKRRAVPLIEEEGLGGKAPAYRALGLARSAAYYLPQERVESRRLRKEIVALSR